MSAKPKIRKPWKDSILRAPLGSRKVQCELVWVDVLCIPLDAASVEALHAKLAEAIHDDAGRLLPVYCYSNAADAVLAALSIKRKARE